MVYVSVGPMGKGAWLDIPAGVDMGETHAASNTASCQMAIVPKIDDGHSVFFRIGCGSLRHVRPLFRATDQGNVGIPADRHIGCLLYTSDAADDLLCVDLGG